MEEMGEPATQQTLGKNSQAARFKKIIKETKFSLVLGGILLILLVAASISYVRISQEETESSMALSQYRLGSKALTAAVQSFAVTGDAQYYDAYMEELNVDKNRDIAWEVLQNNDIKADEWAELNEIAGLSNGLVPLEKEAMAAVAAGNKELYLKIVKIFIHYGEKQAQLKQFISDGDAHGYCAHVHALMGDAKILGAESLADVAYEHKKQSMAGNLAYVEEYWDELVECWERARAGFEEFCRESGRE